MSVVALPLRTQIRTENQCFLCLLIPCLCLAVTLFKSKRRILHFRLCIFQVLPDHEVESAACGYFLKNGLLVRKSVPHGECFVGDDMVQVVLPAKLRPTVLQIAHDSLSGHVGVRKTYD